MKIFSNDFLGIAGYPRRGNPLLGTLDCWFRKTYKKVDQQGTYLIQYL